MQTSMFWNSSHKKLCCLISYVIPQNNFKQIFICPQKIKMTFPMKSEIKLFIYNWKNKLRKILYLSVLVMFYDAILIMFLFLAYFNVSFVPNLLNYSYRNNLL